MFNVTQYKLAHVYVLLLCKIKIQHPPRKLGSDTALIHMYLNLIVTFSDSKTRKINFV